MLPSIFGRLLSAGGRGGESKEVPAEIAEIETIVHQAPDDLKFALIDYYQRGARMTEHAAARGITRWAFKRLLKRAEKYVQSELF